MWDGSFHTPLPATEAHSRRWLRARRPGGRSRPPVPALWVGRLRPAARPALPQAGQGVVDREVFEQLPILRARFCQEPTRSVMPADPWRGRCTVGSVLATAVRFLRQGLGPALEWAACAGDGEEPVSERTVRRWQAITQKRLIGSPFAVLGPAVGWSWSGAPARGRSPRTAGSGVSSRTGRTTTARAPRGSSRWP